MKPITENKPGSRIISGPENGQPEYLPLEVRRGEEGAIWSAWSPSWREMFWLIVGEPVRLGILSQQQPPVIMIVEHAKRKASEGEG